MIIKILKKIYFITSLIIIYTSIYIKHNFNNIGFEQLLYTVIKGKGTSFSAIINGIIIVSTSTIITILLTIIIKTTINNLKYRFFCILEINKKRKKYTIFPPSKKEERIYCAIFFIMSIIFACYYLGVFEYLKQQQEKTLIFENYYVDANKINIDFPTKKRNLIFIFVESLESTNFSKSKGGITEKSYIPHLETFAEEYINFSNTELLGGSFATTGATWTIAGMVAQTAAIPLKLSVGNQYKGYGEFLPGALTIGDILQSNGYNNYLILGSDSMFGGRKDYFKYHGNYQIHDYYWAIEQKLIPNDYKEWWGFEDKKLFAFAKEELIKIAKENKPFNYTILTADTHFTDGYLDKSCPKEFKEQYANVFNCTDIMIYDFINWIQSQDFYSNTTIIITGDHLTMQEGFYNVPNNYSRTVYNVFINSIINTKNNKNRISTTLDIYPTALASLGVQIEGDKIGLGTNLFSDKKTLAEELSVSYLNEEFKKRSNYYNIELLGNSYFELKKKLGDD